MSTSWRRAISKARMPRRGPFFLNDDVAIYSKGLAIKEIFIKGITGIEQTRGYTSSPDGTKTLTFNPFPVKVSEYRRRKFALNSGLSSRVYTVRKS
jgi:hypothetical protein